MNARGEFFRGNDPHQKNGGDDVTVMKIPGLMLLALLFFIPVCSAGSVTAQNATALPAQPYISIDPIGNHALGEIFTISGTTSLPEQQTIQIEIEPDSPLVPKIGPGVFGGGVWYATVVADEDPAANRWSTVINLSGYNRTLVSSKNFLVRATDTSTYNVTGTSEFGITEPYISIDPIGNHTIDEVFFISGTTNLPASGTPLNLKIYSAWFNPGGNGGGYQSNVTIKPGENGINSWSCNATTSLWQSWGIGPYPPVTSDAIPGDYLVIVSSQNPQIIANDSQLISILSPEDSGSATANPELTPYHTNQYTHAQRGYWISVDKLPLGTHFIGDAFGVFGETNLPVGQEIDYGISSARYAPGSPNLLLPSFSGSTIVVRGPDEINTWSFVVNTTRFEKSFENGTRVRTDAVPGDYQLSIGPFNQETYPLTLTDRGTDSQALLLNTTQGTATQTGNLLQEIPTTRASLPPTVSIAAAGLGVIALNGFRKR